MTTFTSAVKGPNGPPHPVTRPARYGARPRTGVEQRRRAGADGTGRAASRGRAVVPMRRPWHPSSSRGRGRAAVGIEATAPRRAACRAEPRSGSSRGRGSGSGSRSGASSARSWSNVVPSGTTGDPGEVDRREAAVSPWPHAHVSSDRAPSWRPDRPDGAGCLRNALRGDSRRKSRGEARSSSAHDGRPVR